jgi:D-alanyl-D-alanine carboxypeptidase
MAERFTTVLFILLFSLAISMFNACSDDSGGGRGFSPAFIQDVTAAFETSVKSNGFPGGVLGLMRVSDGAKMLVATGMAEPVSTVDLDQDSWTTRTPMTTGAHTRIASVSKTFTAIVILMLVDKELISLDQRIDDFFPGLVPNSDIITVRNLLNMTSGLYDHENYLPLVEYILCGDLTTYFSPEELIEMSNTYSDGKVLFQPGEYFKYTNTNFTILAMIAQAVTGKSYKNLVTELIIDKLGLTGTIVPGNTDVNMPQPFAHGYDIPGYQGLGQICVGQDFWKDYSVQNMSWDLGAGSIVSTADDLLRFIKAVYTGELLSPQLRDAMFTPPAITDFDGGGPSRYGFGIFIWPGHLIGHDGSNFGYNTAMDYEDGYYYSVLVNAGMGIVSPDGTQKTGSVFEILADVQSAVGM